MYQVIVLVILQFLKHSSTKLIVDQKGWDELTLEQVTEKADLIESVTEQSETCKWIKVIKNTYVVTVMNKEQNSKIN